jgi:hypothetical protein
MSVMLVLSAILLLGLAAYAQYRIPFHTAGARKARLTRAVLALVGVALGYVSAAYYPDRASAFLAFLAGFGVVHVPAAIILFFKRARGEGRS